VKRVLVLLLASIVGVLLVTRRRKARDSSDLWAEATRALQTPPPTSHGPGASG
jgi:hypothetical protein